MNAIVICVSLFFVLNAVFMTKSQDEILLTTNDSSEIIEEECNRLFTENKEKYSHLLEMPNKLPKHRLKILVNSPTIGWSHCKFQGSIADALVNAGHEVHIFTYALNAFVGNYTGSEKAHKTIRHLRPEHKFHAMRNLKFTTDQYSGPINLILAGAMQDLTRLLADACQEILDDKVLLEQLTDENYDFGISEIYDVCMFGIFNVIGVRAMAASQAVSTTTLIGAIFGVPTFASYIYGFWTFPSNPIQMTFEDRAWNLFNEVFEYTTVRNLPYDIEQPLFDAAFGSKAPNLHDVTRNISLALINNNEFFAISRPISHKIKFIGGIVNENASTELSKEIISVIDNASKGVVLFSLGTYADTRNMNDDIRDAFMEAFAQFPEYEFIWKFTPAENDSFIVPLNVHIYDWVEQVPILAHPKTKLFITHCGLNSVNEAAKYGIPVLGIPLFGDQFYNAAIIANKKMGIILDILKVRQHNTRLIKNSLRQLLIKNEYSRNAALIKQKLALNPFQPSTRLVKWVEFAAEFTDLNELNLPDDIDIFTYYSLDVITAFLALVMVVTTILFIIVRSIVSQCSTFLATKFYTKSINVSPNTYNKKYHKKNLSNSILKNKTI